MIGFLAGVPLLQKLPTASLRKIAQLAVVKIFDAGDYVVREGESGEGVYFVWEGEAQVNTLAGAQYENRPEFLLRRQDYFGYGEKTSVHQADVVALSKLICLVLHHEHYYLLEPKSIWNENLEKCSDVERILHVEPVEVNIFKGITPPGAPAFGKVFGGQLIGQALAAASKSVDLLKFAHSLHAYFLIPGDINTPIIYQVQRVHDGKSFANRRVDAMQRGKVIFTLLASFQKEEVGFEHQEVQMPTVPAPDKLLSMEDLRERRITDPRLPRNYRNKIATANFTPWPIEIRFCEPNTSTNQTKSPPSLRYWFRARGPLSDDQALHRCVLAYTSDLIFLQVSLNPHRRKGLKTRSVSLDHAMCFHRPVRADDWILFVIQSPIAYNARGVSEGRMFNLKGELVASAVQEGLIREANMTNATTKSKL